MSSCLDHSVQLLPQDNKYPLTSAMVSLKLKHFLFGSHKDYPYILFTNVFVCSSLSASPARTVGHMDLIFCMSTDSDTLN